MLNTVHRDFKFLSMKNLKSQQVHPISTYFIVSICIFINNRLVSSQSADAL